MAEKRPASAAAPGVAEAMGYAEAVVAGTVPAGRLARLACERFLRDKGAADAGTGPWGFEPGMVEAALLFAGQMPNIKGPEAGRPLRLMAWQRKNPSGPPDRALSPLRRGRGRGRGLRRRGHPRPGPHPVRGGAEHGPPLARVPRRLRRGRRGKCHLP